MKMTLAAPAAAVAALLAYACPAQAQGQKQKVTIAVASTVFDVSQANNTSIPYYTKCWEREGVDVELQPTNANAATQALITGRVQFVLSGPSTAVQARAKGGKIRSVYLNIRRNFYYTVVPESSAIKELKDFKGKTVGIFSYGTPGYRLFRGVLQEAGVDPDKDVTFVETGLGAQAIAALRTGRVDAWAIWDSQVATAENMGLKFRRFEFPQAAKLNWGSSFYTTDDIIASNSTVVEKVMRCAAEGTVYTQANPEAAVRGHWAVYPDTKPSNMSEAEAMRQARHIVDTRLRFLELREGERWGEMPESAVQSMIDFMRSTGELKEPVQAADLYTNQFVDAINRFDAAAVVQAAKTAK